MKNINIDEYDVLVIGCGLTGSVISRFFADNGKRVLILERRNHIGGNMFDYVDDNNVRVHKYGPHVFHTYDKQLMDYMNKYSEWNDFYITSKVFMHEKFTPSPFNYQTIDDYYDEEQAAKLKSELEKEYPRRDKATIVELLESKNEIVKSYAQFLFDSDYSLYTAKQWGLKPSEIDPSVLKRVPVLFSYKDGYFDDTYQKVPTTGYTALFERLLDNNNITVELNYEALNSLKIVDNEMFFLGKKITMPVVYTGPIDELLEYKYGKLPYRSLDFKWDLTKEKNFQDAALVAYPEVSDYTRITEYNKFPNQESEAERSSLAYEYPLMYDANKSDIEPYYPILTADSMVQYEKYAMEAEKIENLFLRGRLAEFKYYNMDQALKSALDGCENVFSNYVS